jgi:hypothetical protein
LTQIDTDKNYQVFFVFFLIVFSLAACQVTPPPPLTATPIAVAPTFTPSPPPSPTPRLPASPLPPSPTPNPSFPAAPLPLSAFPRPKNDNGLGVHWSTHLYAQSDEATSYFVSELARMNVKWVKLLVDGLTNRDYDRTIDDLVSRDIMPVIRIYQQCNTPYDPDELEAMVRHYVAKGVYYYDLYNEPNQPGESGGWCGDDGQPQPEYLAQIWADAARTIYLAGGYPGLPSFFAPGQKQSNWRDDFFYRFFDALREQGNEEVLYFSWASIHNYMINHPPTYPYDEVNQTGRLLTTAEVERYGLTEAQVAEINLNRTVAGILRTRLLTTEDGAKLGLDQATLDEINRRFTEGELMGFNIYDDNTGFFQFIAFRNQFYDLFGFDIPMISTEGGATKSSGEDPRYPVVDGQTVAEWTLWSADYMLDDAPDYYFTTMTWLLAQGALDYNEPVWEKNAWYHDREGDQEPVVDTLKQRSRLQEARGLCFEAKAEAKAKEKLEVEKCLEASVTPQSETNPLAAYPRPEADNGRGLHGSPTNQPLPKEVVDYFVPELRAMNIKWFKFLQDDAPSVTDPYLIEQLTSSGIEPVMRVYKPFNEPYQHLPELVPQAVKMGVHYFELYNEPNVAGPAGGWPEGEPINVERVVDLWLAAAQQVHSAGGHPSLPPLAGGGTVDDLVFLRQFLAGVRARGQAGLLPHSWLAVHNYFLNHPLDYPTDPVNVDDVPLTEAEIAERALTPEQVEAINHARSIAKLPREQGGFWVGNTIDEDSNAFRKFDAYAKLFYRRFGYYLPVIGTEGGAIIGAAEDPRYPQVRTEDLTILTLGAYHTMLDDALPYFFAQTAWLLANSAGEHADKRFEQAAWYKDREGTVLPVVEALKADPRREEVRPWQEPKPGN